MRALWSDQRKYEIWLEIETLACEAMARLGQIPAADAKAQVAAAKPVNTACPFTGGPANPSLTASAGGKTVAFCCGGCLARFNKMSEADKLATIAKAK